MSLIEHFIPGPSGARNVATSSEGHWPLLMLHGVTRRWQTFLTVADSLSARHQLHALDFRGHGKSDRLPGKYHVIDYAEDAVHYLDDHLKPPVVVYGHSLGAMVTAIVAAERSERIAGVILEDPPFHTMGEAIGDSVLLSLFKGFQPLAGDQRSLAAISHALADLQLEDPLSGKRTRLGDVRDDASLRMTASCLRQLDPAVLEPIVAGEWLKGFSIENVMQRIRCPVLLLQAEITAGGMLTDRDVDSLRRWTEDLIHVKITGCGHLIHWSRTSELLSTVHAFLASLDL